MLHLKGGHIPPPYPDGSAERLFGAWKQAIAAQNYPGGTDAYGGSEAVAAIRRFFPTGRATLLFLGCGDGTEVRHALDAEHDGWGVTLNPNNVRWARDKLGLEHVYYLDAHLLPEEWAGAFDGVMGFQFLEHTPAPIILLLEALRVLKPGGLVYFETPGPDGFTMAESLHHFTCPTRIQAEGWMLKAGFIEVSVEEIGPTDAARHLGIFGRKP